MCLDGEVHALQKDYDSTMGLKTKPKRYTLEAKKKDFAFVPKKIHLRITWGGNKGARRCGRRDSYKACCSWWFPLRRHLGGINGKKIWEEASQLLLPISVQQKSGGNTETGNTGPGKPLKS